MPRLGFDCISLVTEDSAHLLLRSVAFLFEGRPCLPSVFQTQVVFPLLRQDLSTEPGYESSAREHPFPACRVFTFS